jgi:hypothetical protein
MKLKDKLSDLVLLISTYIFSRLPYIIAIILFIIVIIMFASNSVPGMNMMLSWDKSDKAVAYNVYQSKVPGKYDETNKIATTNNTSYDLKVSNDIFLYWAVTAVDSNGRESDNSNEVNNIWWKITCKWFRLNC